MARIPRGGELIQANNCFLEDVQSYMTLMLSCHFVQNRPRGTYQYTKEGDHLTYFPITCMHKERIGCKFVFTTLL